MSSLTAIIAQHIREVEQEMEEPFGDKASQELYGLVEKFDPSSPFESLLRQSFTFSEGIQSSMWDIARNLGLNEVQVKALAVGETEDDAPSVQGRLVSIYDYPDGRELGCGCVVYHSIEVMSASCGSSCAYYYDKMSDNC